jgi:predicted nucleotidyltransferase
VAAAATERELEAVTRAAVARLRRRGYRTIAVTGSAARGDWTAGSDLDLWVIGPHNRRYDWRVRGVPVTVMVETPRHANDLTHLMRVEAAAARVLADPRGAFARVQHRFAANRSQIHRRIRRATLHDIDFHLARSEQGDEVHQVLSLRRAVHRAICLEAFEATGLRDPHPRHFGAVFTRAEQRSIDALMGWRLSPGDVRALADELERVPLAVDAFCRVRLGSPPRISAVDGVLHKLREGDVAEGVEKARAWLDQLAPLLEPTNEPWNVLLPVFPDEVVRAYRLAQDLERASPLRMRRLAERWLLRSRLRALRARP